MAKKFLLALLIAILPVLDYGSDLPARRKFDREAMETFRASGDFNYATDYRPTGSILRNAFLWLFYKLKSFSGGGGNGFIGLNLLRIAIVVVLILGIVLIVRMKYSNTITGNSQIPQTGIMMGTSEVDTNYHQLFQEATDAGDIPLALRYLYLLSLQNLHHQEKIRLSIWKTASDYLQELPSEYQEVFRSIINTYEAAWYGDQKIEKPALFKLIEGAKQLKIA